MLATRGLALEGKTVAVSGFGNVAWGAVKKATELGAKVVTISGPDGYIYDPEGISGEKIDFMLELRASGNDICQPYADEYSSATFFPGEKPWGQKVDIALTCATQNELDGNDAQKLIDNGTMCVLPMPLTSLWQHINSSRRGRPSMLAVWQPRDWK